jgi:hypothetical protein
VNPFPVLWLRDAAPPRFRVIISPPQDGSAEVDILSHFFDILTVGDMGVDIGMWYRVEPY